MTMLACVEVGGSGNQTVLFDEDATPVIFDRAHQPFGARLALAVPGIIEGDRVLAASNLNWHDVDPVSALGLAGPAAAVCNDAEAAALGEAELRGMGSGGSLVFVGLGTGVGGAIVLGEKGWKYDAGSDEFGAIQYETLTKAYQVGEKLEVIVPHCDPAVNEYDQIYGTRKDRVEVVWPITARGHSQ